jgi:RNA polymerase sigma-54 factor
MSSRRQQIRQSLNVNLSQRLALTPSLLQKIELLTLSNLELAEMIREELVANPILEDGAETEDQVQDQDIAEAGVSKTDIEIPENPTAETPIDALDDIDYDYFFNEYLDSGPRQQEFEESDRPSFENFLIHPPSLYDHLNWQLSLSTSPENTVDLAYEIVGNLDPDGYLKISLEEFCAAEECTQEEAEEALRLVQSLDPVGVGARDLQECLLLQLKAMKGDLSLEERIVREFLPLIQAHKHKEICAKLNCDPEDLAGSLEIIRSLNPKPGQRYNPAEAQYIVPEVTITKIDDEFVALLNDDGMPRLRLNPAYREMIRGGKTSGETKEFLREKLRSAMDLLRSIDQRKQTIYRVCSCIIRRQREFLESGIEYLKPMLIKDVASELGVHSSTISRVVTNKYIHTPQGVMELRKFFTIGVEREDGKEVSIVQVKHRIKEMIDSEDSSKPYSDDQLSQMLTRQGIHITRRTVAKYREQMHIAGSRERKIGYQY